MGGVGRRTGAGRGGAGCAGTAAGGVDRRRSRPRCATGPAGAGLGPGDHTGRAVGGDPGNAIALPSGAAPCGPPDLSPHRTGRGWGRHPTRCGATARPHPHRRLAGTRSVAQRPGGRGADARTPGSCRGPCRPACGAVASTRTPQSPGRSPPLPARLPLLLPVRFLPHADHARVGGRGGAGDRPRRRGAGGGGTAAYAAAAARGAGLAADG